MVDLNPYGRKGCTCWPNDDPRWGPHGGESHWLPNVACPFHGVLSDFTPPRNETGTYRVVSAPDDVLAEVEETEIARADPVEGPPPGVHSILDLRDGCPRDEEFGRHLHVPNEELEPVCTPDLATYVCMIKEEERGVLATVRRWARHLGDAFRGRPGWH